MVVIALSILIFTTCVSVLSGIESAPSAFAAGGGYIISSASAPTIFSSQVEMDMVTALESVENITGVSPEVFVFTGWGGSSFVARGVDLRRLNSTGPAFDRFDIVGTVPVTEGSSAMIGSRLLDVLGVDLPCTITLVGSYSARVELVTVVGSFSTGTPLDDELLVSLEVARHLSGTPDAIASIIRVSTTDPAWLSDLLAPDAARFALFDLHLSKAVVATSEPFELSVGVRNWGATAGTVEVSFADNSSVVDTVEVSFDAGASGTVTVSTSQSQLGRYALRASVSGDFPVTLTTYVTVVEPYISIACASSVILGSSFEVTVTDYAGEAIEGASVVFLDQTVATGPDGTAELLADSAGSHDVTASVPGYDSVVRPVSVLDPADFPAEFLPSVTGISISPGTIQESESAEATVFVVNSGSVGGSYELEVSMDGGSFVSVTVLLDPLGQQTVTLSLDDVSVGAHTFRAGNFVGELTVEPWYSDNPDIVQLVVRYGGSNALSSSASLPIYQAAKISEGNVKVALFSVGAIAALLAAIAIISVFSKEVHEGRRRLGVLRTIGASRSDIRRLVFPQALAVALSGAVLGMVAGAVIAGQLSSAGVFVVFGHELELSLGGGIVAVILLATVLISVSSALVSAELAARETAISSIKKLPEEPGEPVDVAALLGEE